MLPYWGHFQLHDFGCWITLYIVPCAVYDDYYFKFQSQSWDAKVIRGKSEDSICLRSITYAPFNTLTFKLEWSLHLNTKSNLIITHIFLVSILNYEHCQIPLKCVNDYKSTIKGPDPYMARPIVNNPQEQTPRMTQVTMRLIGPCTHDIDNIHF